MGGEASDPQIAFNDNAGRILFHLSCRSVDCLCTNNYSPFVKAILSAHLKLIDFPALFEKNFAESFSVVAIEDCVCSGSTRRKRDNENS